MNTLSIEQFLHQYVKELSRQNTDDLSELLQELSTNQRLNGPLIMYAIFCGYDPVLRNQYPEFFTRLDNVAINLYENMPIERACAKVMRTYITYLINTNGGSFPQYPRILF